MNQARSPYAQLFLALQFVTLLIFGYLYYQNQVIGALNNLHGNDFAHNYLAGKLLSQGENPYRADLLLGEAQKLGIERVNPFVYPLFIGLLFIPLSYLSYPQAQWVWFVLSHLFLAAGIFLWLQGLPKTLRPMAGLIILAGLSIFFPLTRTLTAGQLNLFILFLIITGWASQKKGNSVLTGITLGIATLIKLFPGLFLIYYLLRKQYKVFFSGLATLLSITVLLTAFFGLQPMIDYAQMVKEMSYGKSVWAESAEVFHVSPANQSFHALVAHLFTPNKETLPLMDSPELAKELSLLFTLIMISILGWIAYRLGKRHLPAQQEDILYGWVLLTALMVPSLFWDHYLVYNLWIIVLLMVAWAQSQRLTPLKGIILVTILLWMAIPYNFWNIENRQGMGIFWMSFKLYPSLILWGILTFDGFMTTRTHSH